MKTIKKAPWLAVLFGVLAIATAAILVLGAPKIVSYVFAVFWAVTGLLGFYAARKS